MAKGKPAIAHFTPGDDPLTLPATFSFDLEAPPGLTLASAQAALNANVGKQITAGGLPFHLLAVDANPGGQTLRLTVKAWPNA